MLSNGYVARWRRGHEWLHVDPCSYVVSYKDDGLRQPHNVYYKRAMNNERWLWRLGGEYIHFQTAY